MSYVQAWARAFALTVFVEELVAVWLLRGLGVSWPRLAGLVFFAQLASHPAVWFVFPQLPVGWDAIVAMAETWAVVSETVFYWLVVPGVGLRRAFGVAALANAASFGLGLALRAVTGWV